MRPRLWEDTSPAAEQVLLAGYRRMAPSRKLGQVAELTLAVQQLALARLRSEDPSATERQLHDRVASLWLPAALGDRVLAYRSRRVAGR